MPDRRKLIVTHHAPDLDAIGAVWLLKRFDPKNYADAKVAFVEPGERISLKAAREFGAELHEVTHVDTGLGRFDHHQPDRGKQYLCATSLVHDYLTSLDPNLKDNRPLQYLCDYITDIDHFAEINWLETGTPRESFAIYNLIRGLEFLEMYDDDSQLHFGLTCLDSAYAILVQYFKADEALEKRSRAAQYGSINCLYIESRNDDTIKLAQKRGYQLVVRKDPKQGHIRIKARPDSEIDLEPLYHAIKKKDQQGKWFFHPSGKMLLNGSSKHSNQQPSPLTLEEVSVMIKNIYGS